MTRFYLKTLVSIRDEIPTLASLLMLIDRDSKMQIFCPLPFITCFWANSLYEYRHVLVALCFLQGSSFRGYFHLTIIAVVKIQKVDWHSRHAFQRVHILPSSRQMDPLMSLSGASEPSIDDLIT